MSFPRYPKYKDSGVEWLGVVPEGWGVTTLKRGFDVTLGKMLQPESKSPDDELRPYLRAANIQWAGVETTDIKQMWMSERDRAQLRLEHGDLLVSEGGDVGRSCLWAGEVEECYFQNSVNRVRALDGHSNGYLRYWMSTIKDKGYIDVLCNKSTIAHFTAEKVASVPVLFPPPSEQTAIAAFLDRETAKIDGLVTEQRRLMKLLKEKRQAVISHAVTKGLNPDAPMKPSGIEWLGDVPEHWEVKRLRHAVRVDNGPRFPINRSERADMQGEYPYWGPTKIFDYLDHYRFEGERALIGEDGDHFNKYADWPMTQWATGCFNVNNHAHVIASGESCLARWFYYSFRHRDIGPDLIAQGVARLKLTRAALSNLIIACPPVEEQGAIITELDRTVAKIADALASIEQQIDLLQERRTALISAAVTGQIDARQLATDTEAA